MAAETTPQPREIRPGDAEAMRDCLIWLGGDTRWIETEWGQDPYNELATQFRTYAPYGFGEATKSAVMAFLRWMDEGDRLHVNDAPPGWEGIEFHYGDYGSGEAARRQCAEDMVRYYREGE